MQTGHRQLQTGGEPLTRAGGRVGAVRCGACAATGVRVSRGQRRIHHTTGAVFPNMASPASPPLPSQRSAPSGPASSGTPRAHGFGGAVGSQHPFCVSGCLRGVCGRAVPSAGMARGGGLQACGQRPNKRISQIHGASVATGYTDAPETALPGVPGQQEAGRSDGQGRCGPGRARSWVRSGRPTGVLTRISR